MEGAERPGEVTDAAVLGRGGKVAVLELLRMDDRDERVRTEPQQEAQREHERHEPRARRHPRARRDGVGVGGPLTSAQKD